MKIKWGHMPTLFTMWLRPWMNLGRHQTPQMNPRRQQPPWRIVCNLNSKGYCQVVEPMTVMIQRIVKICLQNFPSYNFI